MKQGKIGIFDSGFGGLTIFKSIQNRMPQYDYIYLGDNSRAPYGNKSFETVYKYTWQCVEWLIHQDCTLIILACNTASARALRSIQQNELLAYPNVRVLGVIRPTAEIIGEKSKSKSIGIVGTAGTVKSQTYILEIKKFFPELLVYQHACELWVPLIEANHIHTKDADEIVKQDLEKLFAQSDAIDTLLLACTHYPLLLDTINKYCPPHITIISQGAIVADSLVDYLKRHSEIEQNLSQHNQSIFYTTDDAADFEEKATLFFGKKISAISQKMA